MRYSFLDIAACPNDQRFPLDVVVASKSEVMRKVDRCGIYCSRFARDLEEAPVDPSECLECSSIEIDTGELVCPDCGSKYEIAEGIPKLIWQAGHVDPWSLDKQKEMFARDEQAERYDSLKLLKLLSRFEIPALLSLLDAGNKDLVLELGAGTGRVTAEVASRAAGVLAVDFSFESLKRAKQKHAALNIQWAQADINHLPFRDQVFDASISCQVFEHLPGIPMRNMAVDEAARILKAGGTFAISVYRDSLFWRLWGPKEGYHPGGIYYYRLGLDEFKNLLSRQFTVKEIIPNLGLYLQLAKCAKLR